MNLPVMGDRLPTQGNRVTRGIARLVLRLLGWRFEGTLPNREKLVGILAPHTTAWDFVIGITAVAAIGIRVSWFGVDWMFRIPFMRAIGGVPINRSKTYGVVRGAVEEFGRRERFILGLSPEGSRKKVVPWKTGFHRIARGAGVPIMLVAIDHTEKWIRFGPLVDPSEDYEADMREIVRPFYAEAEEKYPDQFGFE
ncbi:MAG: acyltransferase [bacterium]|nr:acyltransferase [bacterium]